jgi:hypothetical protein
MSKEFKFIQTLLENEKFTHSQKERFFRLVAKEFEKYSKVDEIVLEEIRLIKEKLGIGDKISIKELEEENEEEENEIIDRYKWAPTYINPKGIHNYLLKYNNNIILKSTCHKIDSNELKTINELCGTDTYDFNKHLEKIIEAFEVHDKKYAPGFIKTFIRLYLTGKDYYGNKIGTVIKKNQNILGWTEDAIVFCWSDEKIKTWADKNIAMPPCPSEGLARENKNLGYEFEIPIKNSYNNNISTFSKLVIHFKSMFHVKSGNSLKDLLLKQNEIKEWDKKIDFSINDNEFPSNIELFTYIEKVIQAYNKIIELILEKSKEKPQLRLCLQESKEAVWFTIQHVNSQYKKSFFGIKERLHGQTYKNIIINQINGLCDLFVHADLGNNEYIKANIWDSNYTNHLISKNVNPLKISYSDKPIVGVAHLMKFKKNN